MKRFLSILCVGAFGVACSEIAEPILPQPVQQIAVADNESGTVVSETAAIGVAENFFLNQGGEGLKTRSAADLKTPASVKSIKADAGTPAMHVINYPGGGFAIVSATRDYYPVLAYSDEGSFELTDDMGPVDVWISETKESIRVAENLDTEAKASIRAEWNRLEPASAAISAASESKTRAGYYNPQMDMAFWARMSQLQGGWNYLGSLYEMQPYLSDGAYNTLVSLSQSLNSPEEYTIVGIKEEFIWRQMGPFLTTQWDQEAPFNDLCNQGNTFAGCATIAMAQIINYYEDAGNLSYDWSKMPDFATDSESGDWPELATFIRDIGLLLHMDYANGDSTASTTQSQSAFKLLGYSASLKTHNTTDATQWIRNEGRPLYMYGWDSNSSSGHFWVGDGVRTRVERKNIIVEFINPSTYAYYNNLGYWTPSKPGEDDWEYSFGYFYLNWGWRGRYNGWFGENELAKPGASDGRNYQSNRHNIYAKP